MDVRSTNNRYLTRYTNDLRQFALDGVKRHGYREGIDIDKFTVRQCIDDYISATQIKAAAESYYVPVWVPVIEPTELDFAANNITITIWTIGFLPYFKFIKLQVFDIRGFPESDRGVTYIPGPYFLGLPWMHTCGPSRLCGIAGDADYIASRIEAGIPRPVRCEP